MENFVSMEKDGRAAIKQNTIYLSLATAISNIFQWYIIFYVYVIF